MIDAMNEIQANLATEQISSSDVDMDKDGLSSVQESEEILWRWTMLISFYYCSLRYNLIILFQK